MVDLKIVYEGWWWFDGGKSGVFNDVGCCWSGFYSGRDGAFHNSGDENHGFDGGKE